MLHNNIELEHITLKFLQFISQNAEAATSFFSITGLQPSNLRECCNEYSFFTGVINYLLSDDKLLQDFCNDSNTKPELILNIYNTLSNHNESSV